MATVTGIMADKIVEMVNALVTSITINQETGVLTYKNRGGQEFSAGSVDRVSETLEKVYPIGSIFMSTTSTSPAAQLGIGTWVAWGTGRVPVGVNGDNPLFNSVEKVGGSNKISTAQLPEHKHTSGTLSNNANGAHVHQMGKTDRDGTASTFRTGAFDADETNTLNVGSAGSHTHNITGETGAVGGGEDYMVPYITCYMWKRTS